MSKLFESSAINGMALSNRFVRAATWEGMADDTGAPTQKLIKAISYFLYDLFLLSCFP